MVYVKHSFYPLISLVTDNMALLPQSATKDLSGIPKVKLFILRWIKLSNNTKEVKINTPDKE